MALVDPTAAVPKHVKAVLASVDRVRAAGVVCLVGEEWLAVNVNLTALHDGMEGPDPLAIEREGFCAFDATLGHAEIAELLTHLDAGRLRLPAVCRSAVIPGIAHAHGPSFRARRFAQRDLGIAWPCDEVTFQGGGYECAALPDRFARFVEALPAMDPPIDGRRALERELDIYGDLSVNRGGGHVHVRCPLPVRLVSVRNTETVNELEILVEAHGTAAESFSVSVMPDGGRRSASRILARDFERTSASQLRKRLVLQEPGAVKVTLAVRDGEVADDAHAGVPWAPMLVHQQFDRDCHLLETLLFGPSRRGQRDAREFESGVAWLLHLCGCAAMHLGRKDGGEDLQAAPDIVARTPEGDLVIGECTLLGPPEQKVAKLLERAQAVAALLERAGAPARVRPTIFVGEQCNERSDAIEIVDVTRLKQIVARLRGGMPDGLVWQRERRASTLRQGLGGH